MATAVYDPAKPATAAGAPKPATEPVTVGLVGSAWNQSGTNSNTNGSQRAPGAGPYTTYTPAKAGFGANDTVEHYVQGIIHGNSPLMQQAASRALQNMNARGLVNSSMAIGAAQGALYDAATPMAQTDASLGSNTNIFNAGQNNDAYKLKTAAINQGANDTHLAALQHERDVQLNTWTKELEDIKHKYEEEANATNTGSALYQTYFTGLSQILASPDITFDQKQGYVNQFHDFLQNGLSLITNLNHIDISKLLNFKPATTTAPTNYGTGDWYQTYRPGATGSAAG